MSYEYKLLSMHRPETRTSEVEDEINDWADDGWEVVGYSAFGFRGVAQAGFSHFVLMERESEDDEEDDEDEENWNGENNEGE